MTDTRYEALATKMHEWVWQRCPGCGRKSKYHPGSMGVGEFHSDGCPLEGMYGHKHQWWFEREIARLEEELARALMSDASSGQVHRQDPDL